MEREFQNQDRGYNLMVSLKNLRDKKISCDFEIRVGEHVILVHRNVLMASSDIFLQKMQEGSTIPQHADIEDVNASAVEKCLDFLYSGKISIRLSTIEEIMKASICMELGDIIEYCCEFCLDILLCVNNYDREESKRCEKFFIQYFIRVINTERYRKLKKDEVKYLLRLDPAIPKSDLWTAVKKWIFHDEQERLHYVMEFVQSIDFHPATLCELITKDDLLNTISDDDKKNLLKELLTKDPVAVFKKLNIEEPEQYESNSESIVTKALDELNLLSSMNTVGKKASNLRNKYLYPSTLSQLSTNIPSSSRGNVDFKTSAFEDQSTPTPNNLGKKLKSFEKSSKSSVGSPMQFGTAPKFESPFRTSGSHFGISKDGNGINASIIDQNTAGFAAYAAEQSASFENLANQGNQNGFRIQTDQDQATANQTGLVGNLGNSFLLAGTQPSQFCTGALPMFTKPASSSSPIASSPHLLLPEPYSTVKQSSETTETCQIVQPTGIFENIVNNSPEGNENISLSSSDTYFSCAPLTHIVKPIFQTAEIPEEMRSIALQMEIADLATQRQNTNNTALDMFDIPSDHKQEDNKQTDRSGFGMGSSESSVLPSSTRIGKFDGLSFGTQRSSGPVPKYTFGSSSVQGPNEPSIFGQMNQKFGDSSPPSFRAAAKSGFGPSATTQGLKKVFGSSEFQHNTSSFACPDKRSVASKGFGDFDKSSGNSLGTSAQLGSAPRFGSEPAFGSGRFEMKTAISDADRAGFASFAETEPTSFGDLARQRDSTGFENLPNQNQTSRIKGFDNGGMQAIKFNNRNPIGGAKANQSSSFKEWR